jgi:hypothetical protein
MDPSVLVVGCNEAVQRQTNGPECTFITKNLGHIPFCLRLFTHNPHRTE